MSLFGEIAGMALREGAEAGAGALFRRQAGKMAAEKAAQFAASEVGQRAAARVVGERGAAWLGSQSGQRATRFVAQHEVKQALKGGDGDGGGKPAPKTITAAPPSDIQPLRSAQRSTSRSGGGSKGLMGGTSWWQMGSLTDQQKAGYDWRSFTPDAVAKGQSKPWGLGNAFKSGVSNAIVKNVSRGEDVVGMPDAQGAIGPASIGALGQGVREGKRVTDAFPQLGAGPSYEGTSSRNSAFADGRVNGAIPVAPPAPLGRGPLVMPSPRALGPGATAPVYDPVAAARDRPAGADPDAVKRARSSWPGQPGVRY